MSLSLSGLYLEKSRLLLLIHEGEANESTFTELGRVVAMISTEKRKILSEVKNPLDD